MQMYKTIGRLTDKPEMKTTDNNHVVTKFSLAVNNGKKGSDAAPTFIRCVAFDALAKNVEKYLDKGSPIYAQGKLVQNRWTDKDGNARVDTEFIVSEIEFLDTAAGGLNVFETIARFTADPEIRVTADGQTTIARFSLAVNNGRDAAGEEKPATFIRCVAFNGLANNIEKYVKKGSKVYISGAILPNNWEDKNGKKHYDFECSVKEMIFLDKKNSDDGKTEKEEEAVNVTDFDPSDIFA